MSIRESALNLISSISQSDYLRAVTSGGNSRRVTMANAAKAVVEDYSGSSLGGSQRTVKAAIDAVANDIDTMAIDIDKIAIKNTASGPVASFPDGSDGFPIQSLIADINPVQSGSGDPSPTNIRPISGHNEVGVSVVGKNLAKLDANSYISAQSQSCTISYVDGGLDFTVTGTYARAKYQFSTVVGREYTLSFKGSSDADYRKVQVGNVITWGHSEYGEETLTSTETLYTISFTATSDVVYVGFYISASSTTGTATIRELQLELSPTATTYEPYNGQTYTTALGRTVYGGTLDVVSGELTVDRVLVTFDGTNNVNPWKKSGFALNGYYTDMVANMGNLAIKWVGGNAPPIITDKFKYTSSSNTYFNNYGYTYTDYTIGFNVDPAIAGNTVDSFKAWLAGNPVQVVYELATPQTYQLTPQQIQTALGTNNVWADSGDVEVVYIADTKLYIDNH